MGRLPREPPEVEGRDGPLAPVAELPGGADQAAREQRVGDADLLEHVQRRRVEGGRAQVLRQHLRTLQHDGRDPVPGQERGEHEAHRTAPDDHHPIAARPIASLPSGRPRHGRAAARTLSTAAPQRIEERSRAPAAAASGGSDPSQRRATKRPPLVPSEAGPQSQTMPRRMIAAGRRLPSAPVRPSPPGMSAVSEAPPGRYRLTVTPVPCHARRHGVLGEEERQAPLLPEPGDERRDVHRLPRRHDGGGPVEEEHLGLRRERELLLAAVGEGPGDAAPLLGDRHIPVRQREEAVEFRG